MSDSSARVAIIVSGEVEPYLFQFARDRPVWVIRTRETERAIADLREEGRDVTAFVEGEDPESTLLSVIDEVDLHHGAASGGDLTGLDVVGAPVTDRVREQLALLGLSRLRPTDAGFTAERD